MLASFTRLGLLLDEANRLSQDSLSVLFGLCSNLHLQLLVAAPEVAQAEGNTTYRLVRTVDAEGRECAASAPTSTGSSRTSGPSSSRSAPSPATGSSSPAAGH